MTNEEMRKLLQLIIDKGTEEQKLQLKEDLEKLLKEIREGR